MTDRTLDRLAAIIYQAPLGQYIGREGSETLAHYIGDELALADGEVLFRRGDRAETFFMVTSGTLAVVREETTQRPELVLHVLEPGDIVGELSFIDGTPHTVTVRAEGDAQLISFALPSLDPLVEEHPRLVYNFMRAVLMRVHHTSAAIARQQQDLTDYISGGAKRK